MAIQYLLFSFKILVLVHSCVNVAFCLSSNQNSLFIKKVIPTYRVLNSAIKSFFYFLFATKNTSQYTFVNQYTAIATAEGRSGGGGGGGHGKDDWVIPSFRLYSNRITIQKTKLKFQFLS